MIHSLKKEFEKSVGGGISFIIPFFGQVFGWWHCLFIAWALYLFLFRKKIIF